MRIKKGFVLGAGTMGRGIAQLMAQKGIEAVLVDVKDEILQSSMSVVEKGLQKRVAKGR